MKVLFYLTVLFSVVVYEPSHAQQAWTAVPVQLDGLPIDRASMDLQVHCISPAPGADTTVLWASLLVGDGSSGNRIFLRSTNGGTSWKADTIPVASAYPMLPMNMNSLTNIAALSATSAVGCVVEPNLLSPLDTAYSKVVKTTDAGVTWIVIDSIKAAGLPRCIIALSDSRYYVLYQGITSNTSVVQKAFVRHTVNGGQSWTTTVLDDTVYYSFQAGYGVGTTSPPSLFVPVSLVRREGMNTIHKAHILNIPLAADGSLGVYFLGDLSIPEWSGHAARYALSIRDSAPGYAVEMNPTQGIATGRIYRKTLGNPWISMTGDHFITGHLENRSAVCALPDDPSTIIVTANEGASGDYKRGCAITRNGGTTWTTVDSTTKFADYGLVFINKRWGWAGGYSWNESEPLYIYKWNPGYLLNADSPEENGKHFHVAPNPATDVVSIHLPDNINQSLEYHVVITDVLGNGVVSHHMTERSSASHKMFLGGIPAGVYYVTLRQGATAHTACFIKQ
ncbi:MAG: T9SS type A sorting domain-containing protein [Candidatus Kapabacteria bacterium]|nr:T9SS type A sorting domain-containing protein [Candidatus Kapabacteria bacterium]